MALCKAARAEVPRSSHAVFDPVPQRPDPVGLLEQQAVSRLPELVPIRYGRMASSPFAFFRGAPWSWPPTSPAPPGRDAGSSVR